MVGGVHADARNIADGRGFVYGNAQYAELSGLQSERRSVLSVEDIPVIDGDRYLQELNRLPAYPFLAGLSYRAFGTGRAVEVLQIILDGLVALLLVPYRS